MIAELVSKHAMATHPGGDLAPATALTAPTPISVDESSFDHSPTSGRQLSPGSKWRSASNEMLAQMAMFLKRHPSFEAQLNQPRLREQRSRTEPDGGPSRHGWRKGSWTRPPRCLLPAPRAPLRASRAPRPASCAALVAARALRRLGAPSPQRASSLPPSSRLSASHVAVSRRSFYVLVVVALLAVALKLHELTRQEAARVQADAELARARSRTAVAERALRSAVAGNVALMGLNVVLAVRGVQIWHLLQRVGVEGWIHTIAANLPWTRRVARGWQVLTMPVRKSASALRLPFRPIAAWQQRQVQRAAVEQLAREAAERALRGGPLTNAARILTRQAWSTASHVDRKVWEITRGVFSFVTSKVT